MILDVTIPGDPVGKGRPRVTTRGGFARAFTPEKTVRWETSAAAMFRAAYVGGPLDEPVEVVVEAVGARPASKVPSPKKLAAAPELARRLWRLTKPDGDNVLKAVGDALVAGGVLRDDTRIVRWTCLSLVAALDEGPCVRVRLCRVEGAPA